jgi:hypothetical protein
MAVELHMYSKDTMIAIVQLYVHNVPLVACSPGLRPLPLRASDDLGALM